MQGRLQILIGLAALLIGAVKAWMHAGAVSYLLIPTCSGAMLNVPVGSDNLLMRAHCWGCYVAAFGAFLLVSALISSWRRRRLPVRFGH